jgi:hypothetical protein
MTRAEFMAYKKRFVGLPVPSQRFSDKVLRKLGYNRRDPWVQYLVEDGILNWG